MLRDRFGVPFAVHDVVCYPGEYVLIFGVVENIKYDHLIIRRFYGGRVSRFKCKLERFDRAMIMDLKMLPREYMLGRMELIQCAAVCVAWVECLDRNNECTCSVKGPCYNCR